MSNYICIRFDLRHWIFINAMKFLTSFLQAEIFKSFYSARLPLTQFLTLIQHRLLRLFQRASNNAISNELFTQSKVFITKLAILSHHNPQHVLLTCFYCFFFILRTNQLMNHNIVIILIFRQTLAYLFTVYAPLSILQPFFINLLIRNLIFLFKLSERV